MCIGPAECITYVSDLWSGCTSDKYMFNQSKLPQLLKHGDTVLADKGFLIKEELKALGCKIVTPTYLKECTVQFPKADGQQKSFPYETSCRASNFKNQNIQVFRRSYSV